MSSHAVDLGLCEIFFWRRMAAQDRAGVILIIYSALCTRGTLIRNYNDLLNIVITIIDFE